MRQTLLLATLFSALAGASLACRPAPASVVDAGPQVACSTSADCLTALDGGECVDGYCAFCAQATDCPIGETCVAGSCVTPDGGAGGTSGGSSGGTTTGGTTGGTKITCGPSDGGLPAGQCVTSYDCPPTQACVSGRCATPPSTCHGNNDCICTEVCSGGSCAPKCAKNSDCPTSSPFCYLPNGVCGPCTNSAECGTGQVCTGGLCQSSSGGSCNASHCCNNGDCPRSAPVCNAGSCGPCASSTSCSQGYVCAGGQCVLPDGGTGGCGAGCTGGLICSNGQCVTPCCSTPCGSPSVCDQGNSCTCICPPNCGGSCPSGTTCDTTSCSCASVGGTSGGIGGFPDGGGLPGSCFSNGACGSCPSGQSCVCPFGDACNGTLSSCSILGLGFCQ